VTNGIFLKRFINRGHIAFSVLTLLVGHQGRANGL